ncbi:MAG: hypothetical protein N6V49_11815 [Serratia symbiotica]|nr:hypothetical protein [Serratia symbiotica]
MAGAARYSGWWLVQRTMVAGTGAGAGAGAGAELGTGASAALVQI